MFHAPMYDVGGPGLIIAVLAAGLAMLVVATLIIVFIEAITLRIIKWGSFGRGLLAALTVNFVTTLVGFGLIVFVARYALWGLIVAYLLSVILEALILMMFKRGGARANWIAALIMNTASYALVIFPIYFLSR